MRMSLTSTSGGSPASDESAASPLCAKRALKPSPANTSQSSSHVTGSSSTIMMRGDSCGIAHDLRCQRFHADGQCEAERRARTSVADRLDLSAVCEGDLARDGEAEAAARLLRRPHRLEEMFEHIGRDARAVVAEENLGAAQAAVEPRHDLQPAAAGH